jgi:hypothetical protein
VAETTFEVLQPFIELSITHDITKE